MVGCGIRLFCVGSFLSLVPNLNATQNTNPQARVPQLKTLYKLKIEFCIKNYTKNFVFQWIISSTTVSNSKLRILSNSKIRICKRFWIDFHGLEAILDVEFDFEIEILKIVIKVCLKIVIWSWKSKCIHKSKFGEE